MTNLQDFENLFKGSYAQFYYFTMTMVKDEEVCRDIVGDAFEQLWHHYEEVEADHRKSYIFSIIRNKCINLLRRTMAHQRYSIFFLTIYGDEIDDNSRLIENEEMIQRVEQLLDDLPERTRYMLEQCYFQNKRYAEVAQQEGISVSAVRKHIVKALKYLRDKMGSSYKKN